MSLFYQPLFREIVILVAIFGLMVFCVDKSRQNRRTRNTLYNCIYPLFASAVVKGVQIVDYFIGEGVLRGLIGMLVVVVGFLTYVFFVKRQRDIPYNSLFYYLGLIVMIFLLLFLGLTVYFHLRDGHAFTCIGEKAS